MKVVIVGGVAGGATAAARIRRLDEHAEIVIFERSGFISYANCGLPYYIGDVITDPQELTAQMVNDLVDKIIVHAPDKSSGHRKQKIEIYYNAVGIIDLPTAQEDDCIALHGRCKGKKIAV